MSLHKPGQRLDILHITSAHAADDSRIFHKEAVSGASVGFRVSVAGPHGSDETRHGVGIIAIPKAGNRLLRRIAGPISLFRIVLRERPTVVHFHDPEIIPVGYLLKLLGFKIVYDIHEYYSEIQALRAPAGPLRSLVRSAVKLLVETMPCALFDRAVFPTDGLRQAVAPGPRSVSLINLLPRSLIPQEPSDVEHEYDLVFMGTISPFRAGPLMEMLAHILSKRPGTSLLMLAAGEVTKRWMIENAPSPEVLAAITFHPRVAHEMVFSVLAKARIGFNYHPMERRFQVAIPTKVYEYMACRLPVVCTSFPELARQFENGKEIILLNGEDQTVYAKAVLDLLNNPKNAHQIGQAGWRAVSERLNWDESETPKVRELYGELLNEQTR